MGNRERLSGDSPEVMVQRMLTQEFMSKIIVKNGGLFFGGDDPQPIEIMAKGDRGEKGERGDSGSVGKDGKDGYVGQDGKDGKDGRHGKDGRNGYTPLKLVDYRGICCVVINERNNNLLFSVSCCIRY